MRQDPISQPPQKPFHIPDFERSATLRRARNAPSLNLTRLAACIDQDSPEFKQMVAEMKEDLQKRPKLRQFN